MIGSPKKTEMPFKLSNLNSNCALTLGYLNPALNNPAQDVKVPSTGKRRMLINYTETPSSIPSPSVKGNVAMGRFLCCFLLTLFL